MANFLQSDSRLNNLMPAMAVNGAYAAEVYLKCFIVVENPKFTKSDFPRGSKGHDHVELFNMLTPESKKAIQESCEKGFCREESCYCCDEG